METDKDAIAAGTVALAGVMALSNVLAARHVFIGSDVEAIGEFMLAAVDRSEASETMQAHLNQAVSDHVVELLAHLGPDDGT